MLTCLLPPNEAKDSDDEETSTLISDRTGRTQWPPLRLLKPGPMPPELKPKVTAEIELLVMSVRDQTMPSEPAAMSELTPRYPDAGRKMELPFALLVILRPFTPFCVVHSVMV